MNGAALGDEGGDMEIDWVATAGVETNGAHEVASRGRSLRAERLAYRRAHGLVGGGVSACGETRDVPTVSTGRMDVPCSCCGALMWIEERKRGSSKRNPVFETCCRNGSISLQAFPPPADEIMQLLIGTTAQARHFRRNVRAFNSALAFTSSGAKVDHALANSRSGVYTYRVQGSVYHLISRGLIPDDGANAGFAQIYIYDTDFQLERRMQLYPDLDRGIMSMLQEVLARDNRHVRQFIANNERVLQDEPTQEFELRIGEPAIRDRRYDRPTGSEVAVLLLGDENTGEGERSIILRKRGGGLQRVSQLDRYYDSLHYVLFFPFGEQEGWSVKFKENTGVTMSEYYRFHLMRRPGNEFIHLAGRLAQEYVVDAYAKIEESRLQVVRHNQATLRANLYQGVADQVAAGDRAPGRLLVLPPTFTGGPRYMMRLYQDAMAIVRKLGKPDLFVTMTCNPRWEEIVREAPSTHSDEQYFDLCCRAFRIRLQMLLDLIVKKDFFGKLRGRVHVIEFQKRGLPHAHLLFILDDDSKPTILRRSTKL